MTLFVLFILGTFVIGVFLADKPRVWSYVVAVVTAFAMAFAYYFLDML